MRKALICLTFCFCALFLGGCQSKTESIKSATVQKVGIVETKAGNDYVFNVSGDLVNITSTKYNLDNYLKKKITVTGEFSGDILYIDDLKVTN